MLNISLAVATALNLLLIACNSASTAKEVIQKEVIVEETATEPSDPAICVLEVNPIYGEWQQPGKLTTHDISGELLFTATIVHKLNQHVWEQITTCKTPDGTEFIAKASSPVIIGDSTLTISDSDWNTAEHEDLSCTATVKAGEYSFVIDEDSETLVLTPLHADKAPFRYVRAHEIIKTGNPR